MGITIEQRHPYIPQHQYSIAPVSLTNAIWRQRSRAKLPWVNFGLGNSVLPDGTELLIGLVLTCHSWGNCTERYRPIHSGWQLHILPHLPLANEFRPRCNIRFYVLVYISHEISDFAQALKTKCLRVPEINYLNGTIASLWYFTSGT